MAYAKYCSDRSIAYVKYDGKSGTNKQDFRDPDAAWGHVWPARYIGISTGAGQERARVDGTACMRQE